MDYLLLLEGFIIVLLCLKVIIIIIIIINVIYMAQIRRMQQMRHVDCYRRYSLCHEKCFQTCTEDRQRHVQSDCLICSYVTDSVVAVTVCMFLFIVPARKPNYFCLWNPSGVAYSFARLVCSLTVTILNGF